MMQPPETITGRFLEVFYRVEPPEKEVKRHPIAAKVEVQDLVACDFFTVPSATFRVFFVCIVSAHDRRRIVHFNVTEHPTAQWTAQQIIEAFPWEEAPRYLQLGPVRKLPEIGSLHHHYERIAA